MPRINGQVERMNGVLERIIRSAVDRDQSNWHLYVRPAVYACNTAVHCQTKETLYYMLFGEDAVVLPASLPEYRPLNLVDSEDYLVRKRDILKYTWECARHQIQMAQDKMREEEETKRKPEDRLRRGEQVMVQARHAHQKGLTNKLKQRWNGPWTVIDDTLYPNVVVERKQGKKRIRRTVHTLQCKRYSDRTAPQLDEGYVGDGDLDWRDSQESMTEPRQRGPRRRRRNKNCQRRSTSKQEEPLESPPVLDQRDTGIALRQPKESGPGPVEALSQTADARRPTRTRRVPVRYRDEY
jgi:hypothetical protein